MRRSEMKFLSLMVLAMSVSLSQMVFGQTGQMDRELEQLYAGTNINPFDAAASNNLALKFFRQGQYERALKLLLRAQRLAPDRRHIKENAEYLQLLMSQVKNLDVETANSLSRTFESAEIPYVPEPWGQWGSRIVTVDSSSGAERPESSQPSGVNANPFDVDSLIIIADIKINRGDLRGALNDLERAERISPWISGLSARIAQLQAQVPTDIVADIKGVDHISAVSPDPVAEDAPPPAAWSVEEQPSLYLE